ncbi:YELLOW STRIPE like 7 [Perilla frutescens var. frutescens]|nr:YELLOW STRIPE like 7 [Perilla frutescens var. frutescens]
MKLNLTIGMIPSLNVSAGFLGFFIVKTWTKMMAKYGMPSWGSRPFTRQENTVIQTCVVASTGIAFSGGFGSYLLGMSDRIAKQSEQNQDGLDYKNITLGWMIIFLAAVSFLGLFCVVPLSKVMIIDLKLTYPTGTATAHLINSFHTPKGGKLRNTITKDKYCSSFFVQAVGYSHIFLRNYRFYFDFSATYVGVGMICPHIVNVSALVGGILSWGILWPFIENKKGDRYPAALPSNSLKGMRGYQLFISMAIILGDGAYNYFKVVLLTLSRYKAKRGETESCSPSSYDEQKRTRLFLKNRIPTWLAVAGYASIAAITSVTLPHILQHLRWYMLFGTLPRIFHQLKWYYIIVLYMFAPTLALCNAFGCGLTDWSLASSYGKLAIFGIAAWAGASHGGVVASLAACGVMMNIVSTASDLMQDMKTGYLTLVSPRVMFLSQVIGTGMGCLISPCVFWVFYRAFPDLGYPTSEFPAPYALAYYNMAKLGVEGFSALPDNCLNLCYGFFAAAVVVNLVRDLVGKKRSQFIPIPMAMGIPFYVGPYFAIDMCVGSLVIFMWQRRNKVEADALGPIVASGLVCGDGMWTFPSSLLALAGIKPPICMKFLSRTTNSRVDKFLDFR